MNLQGLARRRHPLIDLVVWTALLTVAGGALWALGRSLPVPPTRPADTLDWLDRQGAASAAAWLLLGAALLAVAHLLVLHARATTARIGGVPRLRIVLHHLPGRVGRQMVERTVGVGLAAGVAGALVPSAALADGPPPPEESAMTSTTVSPDGAAEEPALMVPLTPESRVAEPAGPAGPTTTAPAEAHEATTGPRQATAGHAAAEEEREEPVHVTMRSVEADAPEVDAPEEERAGEVVVTEPVTDPHPAPDAPQSGTWQVELGDHLWSIAVETVTDARGTAEDTAVLGYWQALIDANREQLVDPADPDLLFPGQVLVLPPVVAPG